ncbi:lytic murein transglycosylase [Nocardia neocaledoniensis]|uniref:lytic murein transglycosylase n=1 Tax=Nocardia neocaledoniensis TaxID=236511 RepID=UPI0024547E1A|nr:lytic murein transglycosylase [Nocardia neocaledoniensis]
MSALVVAGLVASGSSVQTATPSKAPTAPEALLAAAASSTEDTPETDPSEVVGLLPIAQEAPRKLRALTPSANSQAPFAGTVPLQSISLPTGSGALGIPEIVLAAYRNAELALETAQPGCGLTWNLLAGIGRIESGHASNGRTDAAGTSTTPIFGPALDGTLPGNEIIKEADGGFVRAVGPMQFLPSTWAHYSADGNGDGVTDPHNVFDAALGAGKYLCSGGLNLRDAAQELRAVLRYNNSMSYAANVLSWSAAYRTGGAPSQVTISPDIVPPGSAPMVSPNVLAASTDAPVTAAPPSTTNQLPPNTPKVTTPTQVMITLPGLPPIPCGIFCPAPVAPPQDCVSEPVPAQMPNPVEPGKPVEQTFGAAAPKDPAQPEQANDQQANAPVCTPATAEPVPAPVEKAEPVPEKTPEPGIEATEEPAPAPAAPTPTPQPGITLPFNIVIPLPPAPPAP